MGARRARLERRSIAFTPSLMLSPLVEPSVALGQRIVDGKLEGVVLKDRTAPYRSGSRRGWSKLKAPDWHAKHR